MCTAHLLFRLEYRNPLLDDRINGFCARFRGVGGEIFLKGQKPSLFVAANMVAFPSAFFFVIYGSVNSYALILGVLVAILLVKEEGYIRVVR